MGEEQKAATANVGLVSKTRIAGATVIAVLTGIAGAIRNMDTIAKVVSPSSLRSVTVTMSPFAWFFDYGFWVLLWLLFAASVVYLFWASLANRVSRQGVALESRLTEIASAQRDLSGKIDGLLEQRLKMIDWVNGIASKVDKIEYDVKLLHSQEYARTAMEPPKP
jgi:hypothetical protein